MSGGTTDDPRFTVLLGDSKSEIAMDAAELIGLEGVINEFNFVVSNLVPLRQSSGNGE